MFRELRDVELEQSRKIGSGTARCSTSRCVAADHSHPANTTAAFLGLFSRQASRVAEQRPFPVKPPPDTGAIDRVPQGGPLARACLARGDNEAASRAYGLKTA